MQSNTDKARALFLHAVGKLPPHAWAAYVAEECGPDTELQRQVMHFLNVHQQAGSFLEQPAVAALQPTAAHPAPDAPPPAEGPGTMIGPYKLLQEIGEGGMGTVYMAQQTEPVKRQVALKVIKPGMDSRQVVARFEAERQALALMDHPNIAQVFDGGAISEPAGRGRPYFVMELVRGVPITDFCDENRLGVRERLELFVSVCQAVQHAHQKGVIHRDIKPSNVLVTWHDDKAVVKVIDFGIAKATGQQLTDKTLFTNFAQMIGTPLYMSPEQAQLSGLDVDTRSDIYSLGVLLYELLTGTTPFDRERLRTVGFDELRRIIREEEPARPSTRLSTQGQAASTASANRRSDPRRLSRLLRGELDWIVMKALEKDRNRRYESASAFAADVQRHLNKEPVSACPPSVGYRLRTFLRRHKGPVLAASGILLLLTAGIVGTTSGLLWALGERDQKDTALRVVEKERDQKEEARRDAVSQRDQKEEARRLAVQRRDEADRNWRQARRALRTLTDDVVEDLLGGQAQLTDRHREFLKKVLAYHADLAAAARADDPEGPQIKAEGYYLVGHIHHLLGETRQAEKAYRDAVPLLTTLADEFPKRPEFRSDLALTHNHLGVLLKETGRTEEAEKNHNSALRIRTRLVDEFPDRPAYLHELTRTLINLGGLLRDTGRLKEAESDFREAVANSKRLVTDFSPRAERLNDLAVSQNNLATLLYLTGQPEEAEAAWRDAVAVRKKLAADFPDVPDHQHGLAKAQMNLATFLRDGGQEKEPGDLYREALASCKRLAADYPGRPDYHSGLADIQYNLAILLQKTGRLKEAEEAIRDALTLRKQLAADFPNRPGYRLDLAKAYTLLGILAQDAGRLVEAEKAHRDAVALLKTLAADFHKQPEFRQILALADANLAALLLDTGRPAAAETAFGDALNIQKDLRDEFPTRSDYRSELAGTYQNFAVLLIKARRPKEAEDAWRNSVDLCRQLTVDFPKAAEHQNALASTLTGLATMLRGTGRPKEAEEAFNEAVTIGKGLTAEFPKRADFRGTLALARNNLGVLLHTLRRHEEAESAYTEAVKLGKQLVTDFPGRTDFRQELARANNNLGALLVDLRRPKEAESAYNDAITLWKELAAAMRNRPDYREELGRTYDNLSHLMRATRRPNEAEAAWRDALAVRRTMVADFPNVPDYHNDLAGSLVNMALLHRNRQEFDAGLALLKEARPHHEAALKADPNDPVYRHFYRNHLIHLAGCYLGLSNFAQAAATADELVRFGYAPAADNYEAARDLSACAAGAGMDAQLDEAKRKELVQSYSDRSLARLQEAVARGFKDAARIKQDPAFQPIREREEFKKLLAELEEKSKK
jgi:serine/threonine protein kinase